MARARIAPEERVKSAGISLHPKLIHAAQKVAVAKGTSLSALVRERFLLMPDILGELTGKPSKPKVRARVLSCRV